MAKLPKIDPERMAVAFHEAGHAVAAVLGGHEVDLVAVKIPGDEDRFRQFAEKVFGTTLDERLGGFVDIEVETIPGITTRPDPIANTDIDPEEFAAWMQSQDEAGQEEARRFVRSWICFSLAGIVATKILRDQGAGFVKVPRRIFDRDCDDPDYRDAVNLSKLLDGGKTLARCMEATEAALLAYSPQLTKIATIAYTIGLVGGQGLQEILPAPLHGWPEK
jgi:hypothetical protein